MNSITVKDMHGQILTPAGKYALRKIPSSLPLKIILLDCVLLLNVITAEKRVEFRGHNHVDRLER